jgi:antitoxin HicB
MTIAATDIPAQVARLMALPYTRELLPNEDGTWFARIVEFPGCMTEGDTQSAALEMLDEAMADWLTAKLEDGDPIPAPLAPEAFSGKFVVRASRSLHRDLARNAEREGVSLNQYVVTKLARACD